MKNRAVIPIAVVIIVLLTATLYFEVFRNMNKKIGKLEGSGTIETTEIEISTKIAGRVAELPFDEGGEVKKGQLIVKLEDDDLIAERNSARANLDNADKNLRRTRDLYNAGSVSKREFDNAEAAYRVAKANQELIAANIENAVIFSPINGILLERNLEIGEMAFPGSAIITLADLSKPWIKIYVDEKKLGSIKLGQKAYIKVDSFPDKKFPGEVVLISSKAEFTPRTIQTKDERVKLMYAVKIAVENPQMELKPGMPADATILLESKK